jgi:hypothetical protein
MIITDVTNAIFDKYKSSVELKNVLSGGFYFQQAPQDVDSPYTVFVINGIEQDEIMGTADDNITKVSVSFDVISEAADDGDDVSLIVEKITKVFDWVRLPIDHWRCIMMQRENVESLNYGDNIWQTTINYTLGLQKE